MMTVLLSIYGVVAGFGLFLAFMHVFCDGGSKKYIAWALLWPLLLVGFGVQGFAALWGEEHRLDRRKRELEREARLLIKRAEVEKLETEYRKAFDRYVGSA